jgi:hypothetical protein
LKAGLLSRGNARQQIALHLPRTLLLSDAPSRTAQSSSNVAQRTGIDLTI